MTDPVHVKLSQREALVLHAWFAENMDSLPISDQAEQRVLWDLDATLEKQIVSIFSETYGDQLARARDSVRDPID